MGIVKNSEAIDFPSITSPDCTAGADPAADTKTATGPTTGNNRPDTRFPKGISGNPRGRPAGTRNRATLLREARLAERIDRQLDGMLEALVAKALSGHVGAIRTALALSLSADRLDLPEAAEGEGETLPEAAPAGPVPLPVSSAKNSSPPAPPGGRAIACINSQNTASSARPGCHAPRLHPRRAAGHRWGGAAGLPRRSGRAGRA